MTFYRFLVRCVCVTVTTTRVMCPAVMCLSGCQTVSDDNGCDTCACPPVASESKSLCNRTVSSAVDLINWVCNCAISIFVISVIITIFIWNVFRRPEAAVTLPGRSVCGPITCNMSCAYDFLMDSNGCRVCRCFNPCAVRRRRLCYRFTSSHTS